MDWAEEEFGAERKSKNVWRRNLIWKKSLKDYKLGVLDVKPNGKGIFEREIHMGVGEKCFVPS